MVIYGVSDFLLAAQVSLGGLHRDVPKEKLNLFEFAAGNMAEPSAGASKAVGRMYTDGELGTQNGNRA